VIRLGERVWRGMSHENSCLKFSISIVHHDGLAMLKDCLRTLTQNPPTCTYEIVVVDNCSTDGTREFLKKDYPQIVLIENTERHGFGENHNIALKQCRGEYVFLLNDDTLIHAGALDALVEVLDARPDVVVVGPKLLNRDGTLQKSCYRFPSPTRCLWENLLLTAAFPNSPLFGDYRAWAHDTVREVDFVIGAALLIRRSIFDKVGGFDPHFFMYAEETDLQKRLSVAGGKVLFTPDAVITHLSGGSSEGMKSRQFCEFNRSGAKYTRKHHGVFGLAVHRASMIFGAVFRLTLWTLLYPIKRSTAKAQIETWARLLKWWMGFGPHEGIAELVQQKSRPISAAQGEN